MRLVLVGPMTGHADHGFQAFDHARDRLTVLGYDVDTPADLDRQMKWVFEDGGTVAITETFDYETAMALGFERIEKADGIVLLPGFAQSPGSIRELHHALTHGKQVFYVYDWADDRPLRRIS